MGLLGDGEHGPPTSGVCSVDRSGEKGKFSLQGGLAPTSQDFAASWSQCKRYYHQIHVFLVSQTLPKLAIQLWMQFYLPRKHKRP